MNKFATTRSFTLGQFFLGLFFLFFCNLSVTLANGIIVGDPFPNADPYGISPFHEWKAIESEHFRFSFPSEYSTVAQKIANLYEEAHQRYVPLFRWEPLQKTLVVLLDNQDTANGLTSSLGRFGMVLWLTPPDSWQNINYYDDWLRFLIFHEYTHFMNMDTTAGIYQWMRPVLLDVLLPNVLWPSWMLEGLAVYMETQFTSAGRGRSTEYEMVLRAAVEERVLNTRAFVSLDQVNGNNPYYPSGDTRYQFGYHLMNQVAKQPKDAGVFGKDALGLLSYRSASEVPFFLNDSLMGVIKKDWYEIWVEWVEQTQRRINQELTRVRAQPVTSLKWLTDHSRSQTNEVSGIAASRDGKWLAYTLVSADRRSGLYLRNLQTQESRRLSDKLLGVGMQFTPDSRALVYSEFNTLDQYTGFSDLKVYEMESQAIYPLSERLRAKDPDVSLDGQWVVFTKTELSRVVLARAPLLKRDHEGYQIGPVEVLYQPDLYERVANPKFSADGGKVYFSFHPNGKSEENLAEFDLKTRVEKILWTDGSYNRYPVVDPQGRLYFVSNLTGIDNLYLYRGERQPPRMISNVTTGVRLPCFAPDAMGKKVYWSHFSTAGWGIVEANLEQILGQAELSPTLAKISPPPAPPLSEDSIPKTPRRVYPVETYSPYSSLLPRGVSPVGAVDARGVSLGAQTIGFDHLDLHRYSLGASFSSQIQSGSIYALYSNRTLGPNLSFSGGYLATVTGSNSVFTQFSRQAFFTGSMAFPVVRTYSEWVPSLSFNLGRTFNYLTDSVQMVSQPGGGPIVASVDAGLVFSNQETSRLAVTSEGGRYSVLGSRYYFLPDSPVWKLYLQDREYIRIGSHTIISPSVAAEWTSAQSAIYPWANALLQGRSAVSVANSVPGDSLTFLGIRGYPNYLFYGRAAIRPMLDFRIPISRVFGGIGTQRFFFDNLYAVAFAESSVLWGRGAPEILPSVGGGIRLSSEVFYIPVTWGIEFHQGFNRSLGGTSDLFFNVLASGLTF